MNNIRKGAERNFIAYLKERFGFEKSDFEGFVFVADRKRVYLTTEDVAEMGNFSKKQHSYGIIAGRLQREGRLIKPTTNLFQLFGKKAKMNTIKIDDEEKEYFIRGFDIEVEDADATNGYVIVSWKGHIIGCGLLKDGIMHNQLPKNRIIKI